MTDKKNTDEEIIKVLECCAYNDGCKGCKYSKQCDGASYLIDALDLINRQNAEIERLKGSTVVNNIMESQRIKREAKAESYKEFAKLLIDKASKGLIHVSDLPNFVKEMVGEEE